MSAEPTPPTAEHEALVDELRAALTGNTQLAVDLLLALRVMQPETLARIVAACRTAKTDARKIGGPMRVEFHPGRNGRPDQVDIQPAVEKFLDTQGGGRAQSRRRVVERDEGNSSPLSSDLPGPAV